MTLLHRCRRRLVGIVAGWKQAVVARLWAKPATLAHAMGIRWGISASREDSREEGPWRSLIGAAVG